jgi:hypothetical protein
LSYRVVEKFHCCEKGKVAKNEKRVRAKLKNCIKSVRESAKFVNVKVTRGTSKMRTKREYDPMKSAKIQNLRARQSGKNEESKRNNAKISSFQCEK